MLGEKGRIGWARRKNGTQLERTQSCQAEQPMSVPHLTIPFWRGAWVLPCFRRELADIEVVDAFRGVGESMLANSLSICSTAAVKTL